MLTKIITLIIQTYLVSKASSPPNSPTSNSPTKKAKKATSLEGLVGWVVANVIPSLTSILVIIQALIYIYILFLQEIDGNHKFSDWSLLEVVLFSCGIGGASIRLWCFKCLKEYFTFNITIKKDHKLITTGPYSLLVHPSYTGGTLMIAGIVFTWYQLCSNAPSGPFGSFVQIFGWWNIIVQIAFLSLIYRRIFDEEAMLKKHFGKEWDAYFSQRKRLIPYIF